MVIGTIADIVGPVALQALSATSLKAVWIAFTASGSAVNLTTRAGDKNVSSSRGALIAVCTTSVSQPPLIFPNGLNPFDVYDLANVYVSVPANTTVSVTFGGVD